MMILHQMRVIKMSSMELIKKLRETTGSGIVDCKKAYLKIIMILKQQLNG